MVKTASTMKKIGTPAPDFHLLNVDGRIVGWIARAPYRRISTAADTAFQQEQLRAAWIIARPLRRGGSRARARCRW